MSSGWERVICWCDEVRRLEKLLNSTRAQRNEEILKVIKIDPTVTITDVSDLTMLPRHTIRALLPNKDSRKNLP
jgi:hypothetical protein